MRWVYYIYAEFATIIDQLDEPDEPDKLAGKIKGIEGVGTVKGSINDTYDSCLIVVISERDILEELTTVTVPSLIKLEVFHMEASQGQLKRAS